VLEMIKRRLVDARQEALFGDVVIVPAEPSEAALPPEDGEWN